MFAQPVTDAFRPTIKPPETAGPDVVELDGMDGDRGTAGAGTGGAGCVGVVPAFSGCGRGEGLRLLAPA